MPYVIRTTPAMRAPGAVDDAIRAALAAAAASAPSNGRRPKAPR